MKKLSIISSEELLNTNIVKNKILNNIDYEKINLNSLKVNTLKSKRILFLIKLNEIGYDEYILKFLLKVKKLNIDFENSIGSIIILSDSSLYTKSFASSLIFLANSLKCSFIGHPMIEKTKDYKNFLTWQKRLNIPLEDIFIDFCKKLIKRVLNYNYKKKYDKNICVLHSSSKKTSNTLGFWNKIKSKLDDRINIKELHVENGTVLDCIGCSYTMCMHYSKQKSCYYGGFMIKEIFPEIEKANSIVFLCPNYNDSISANLMAVINRLTALYRNINFYNKALYSVIVSGNSGSDSLAKQLIDALCINKGFFLPANFCTCEIAYEPNSIYDVFDIDKKSKIFAKNIEEYLL